MKVVTVCNQKGGSGKTTYSVLVTLALASRGHKVLAVDTDPQGGLTSFLTDSSRHDFTVNEWLQGRDLETVTVQREGWTFDMLPANHVFDRVYTGIDHLSIKRELKYVQGFDYIVFDTPPTMQGITQAAITVSDYVLVPADISRSTIGPTLYTLERITELERSGNVFLIGKELTQDAKSTYWNKLHREFLDQLGQAFTGYIPKSATLLKAVSDEGTRWTAKKQETFLQPILENLGAI